MQTPFRIPYMRLNANVDLLANYNYIIANKKKTPEHSTRRHSVTELFRIDFEISIHNLERNFLLLFVACFAFYLFEADELVRKYELIILFYRCVFMRRSTEMAPRNQCKWCRPPIRL